MARGLSARSQLDEVSLRRHLGACLATCHVAVQFKNPAEVLRRLLGEGIRVSGIQLSAALRTGGSSASRVALEAILRAVYLNQVKARRPGGSISSHVDLRDARSRGAAPSIFMCRYFGMTTA